MRGKTLADTVRTRIPGIQHFLDDHRPEYACHQKMVRCESNKRENITLAATFDFLLPKLMSGEIRVRDADVIAREVALA